jgi:hypothetical protein
MSSIAELTSPVSVKKDLRLIKKVVKQLAKCDLNPSERCGFHVHIDIHDIDQYQFMAGWMIYEKAILSCFPLDRRKSSHCEKIVEYPQQSQSYVARLLEEKVIQTDHTGAISLFYYDERGTVEIRVGEGTDDADFVVNWVEFLLYFIDFVRKQNPCLITCHKCNSIHFDDLIKELPMKKSVREFMIGRYNKYGKLPYWTH